VNLYLIGYRGTGKTTLGKRLAAKLGWQFIDSDDEIVNESGMTINEMVDREGWPSFRALERRTMQRIAGLDNCVVATGGGVVLDPENVTTMKADGKIVWLRAAPQTIKARILSDENTGDLRPALTDKGLEAEIEETLKAREPLYRSAMDFSLNTDSMGVDTLCVQVMEAIGCLGYKNR
jgi:shikimate kinase